jgi:hypothetical protein
MSRAAQPPEGACRGASLEQRADVRNPNALAETRKSILKLSGLNEAAVILVVQREGLLQCCPRRFARSSLAGDSFLQQRLESGHVHLVVMRVERDRVTFLPHWPPHFFRPRQPAIRAIGKANAGEQVGLALAPSLLVLLFCAPLGAVGDVASRAPSC